MRAILRLFHILVTRYRRRLFLAYVSVFGAAAFSLAIPRLLGESVNEVLETAQGSLDPLFQLALVLLFVGIARGLFQFGQTYLAESLSQKVAYDLRNAYFHKLQHLSHAFHDRQQTGGLMARATVDVEGVRMFINMGAVRIGFMLSMIIGIAIAMFITDVAIALVGMAFVPVLAALAIYSSRILRRTWLRVQELIADLVTILQENLSGMRVVKAFAAQDYERRKFQEQNREVTRYMLRAEGMWAGNFSFMNFAFLAATGLILLVGGSAVIDGKQVVDGTVEYTGLTPGELTSFIFYMGMLIMPVRMLGWLVNTFSRAASAGERIFEILDAPSPVREKPGAIDLGRVQGGIAFEHVSLRYSEELSPVLEDITVRIEPGQKVALVGRPGSGKSSFVHLLPRFYDATDGRITIDGIDVRDATLESLRSNVGIVQQDVFIYSASIRDNIAYGHVNATGEEVVRAAGVAQLHDIVEQMPDGYDTVLGERGSGLSGGQRQRLAIARTIVTDPPVLVLDDSTSSVDVHTEREIQRGLREVLRDRTSIVIANRISSITDADLILVFKDGRVIERGTHEELLAMHGEYSELYQYQVRAQEEPAGAAAYGSDD